MTRLAVSGHRNISLTPRMRDQFLQIVRERGVKLVYQGMALGFDQEVAHLCLTHNIRQVACIPCRGQADRWTVNQRITYAGLLLQIESAGGMIYRKDIPYSPSAMFLRNQYMVDQGDLLVVAYDGRELGGTFQAVEYGKRQGKEVINLL